LVGINLLREGLDLPEVSLVAIMDADKEGFLRSETSMIQTMGRAARHVRGRVILYADSVTGSMERAMAETQRRREYQVRYNLEHGITPRSVSKAVRERLIERAEEETEVLSTANGSGSGRKARKPLLVNLDKKLAVDVNNFDPADYTPYERKALAGKLRRKMGAAAKEMDFELAAVIRDTIRKLD
jgi:excinuclease ABC subunit B